MSNPERRLRRTGDSSPPDAPPSTPEEETMPKLRVTNFSISLDGYGAGPDQSIDNGLGIGGERLHEWAIATRSWRRPHGMDGGDTGIDDDFWARGQAGVGATIMGRNMFGPIRGPWGDERWTGWWGDDPPYHHPVFVLTNHPRPSITMQGGTVFHFVDGGIEAAREQALDAAAGHDVWVAGGAATIQQYLRARLLDELHVAIVPVFLGGGERLFDNLDGAVDGYECVELVSSPAVVHVRLERKTAAT
jgi:dihydrofolate reductase